MTDSKLLYRLGAYLKPYWKIAGIALTSLIISTIAELLIPIIIKSAIDENLYPQYESITINDGTTPEEFIQTLNHNGRFTTQKIYNIGSSILIPRKDIDYTIKNNSTHESLRNYLENNRSHSLIVPIELGDNTQRLIREHNLSLIGTTGTYRGLPIKLLDDLSPEEVMTLRTNDIQGLNGKVWLFFGLLGITLIFTFGQVYFTAKAGQGVMKDLRIQIFRHVTRQRLGALQNIPIGTLVSRVTNDVETINELFTSVITSLLKDLSLMVGVIITLILLDINLGLITIATLPPVLVLTLIFRSKSRKAYRSVRHWVSEVTRYLSEHIAGMSVIHAYVQEQRVKKEFSKKNRSLLSANLSEMYVFAIFRPTVDLLATLSTAAIIYFGAIQYLGGLVSLGVVVAFINLIGRFYQPVMDMSEKFTILQSAMAGGERVFSFLDSSDEIQSNGVTIKPEGIAGAIRFEDVYFEYKTDEPVIKGLNFSITPGQKIAIVGHTGAGKSTIANLLTRMWDINRGSIWLDGVPIQAYELSCLRQVIQPIQQELSLFSDTIRNNVLLGEEIPDKELWNILEAAQAKEFVEKLPDGLDTHLSEGASNLSTGQRQLIAFARIIAQNPKVIILDEATANIDTETELKIQKAMSVVLDQRTSIIIAHRLSTIKNADLIIVLAHGRVHEQGTHEQLLTEGGVYAQLYRMQFKE